MVYIYIYQHVCVYVCVGACVCAIRNTARESGEHRVHFIIINEPFTISDLTNISTGHQCYLIHTVVIKHRAMIIPS